MWSGLSARSQLQQAEDQFPAPDEPMSMRNCPGEKRASAEFLEETAPMEEMPSVLMGSGQGDFANGAAPVPGDRRPLLRPVEADAQLAAPSRPT